MNTKKLFIVVNVDWFFLSHRKEISVAAKDAGWDVTIVAHDTGKTDGIKNLGVKYINLPIDATGLNPLHELKTFLFLRKLYKQNQDAIVHHVGLKNILWGSLAARMANVKGVVNAVSGLGSLFTNDNSIVTKTLLKILKIGHHKRNLKVIFQNHDDESLFDSYKIIQKTQKEFIKGSGVDLDLFSFSEMPDDSEKIKVIFTGRMIEEKGVITLVDAANLLRDKFENKVEFLLVGGLYPNPKALNEDDLTRLCDGKYIKWLGYRNDVKDLLAQSSIVAFPSYYREGLPKSLIEANAIGRPIITTDSVGCRDTVEDGVNGFIISIKDSKALADKLQILIENRYLREKMGKEARRIAERDFSLENVVKKHLEIYDALAYEIN